MLGDPNLGVLTLALDYDQVDMVFAAMFPTEAEQFRLVGQCATKFPNRNPNPKPGLPRNAKWPFELWIRL